MQTPCMTLEILHLFIPEQPTHYWMTGMVQELAQVTKTLTSYVGGEASYLSKSVLPTSSLW